MVDTKTPGDKTLSVPTKTLTLKPRVEQGTVRQSFSHGRTKQVVVEKRGKRRIGGDGPATETPAHTPEPVKAAVPGALKPFTKNRVELSKAEDDFALSLIKKLECPVILVLNKMDAIPKADLLPLMAQDFRSVAFRCPPPKPFTVAGY